MGAGRRKLETTLLRQLHPKTAELGESRGALGADAHTPEFSSSAEAKSSLLRVPGDARCPLASISSAARGDRASVSPSSTISSSSTPTVNDAVSANFDSIIQAVCQPSRRPFRIRRRSRALPGGAPHG